MANNKLICEKLSQGRGKKIHDYNYLNSCTFRAKSTVDILCLKIPIIILTKDNDDSKSS